MKICTGFALIAALLSSLSIAHAADTTAIMTSAEATEEYNSRNQSEGSNPNDAPPLTDTSRAPPITPTGISRAGLFSDFLGDAPSPVHVSTFSMLMGPSMNNFRSSAPSAAEPFSGISVRHELRADYDLSERFSIGPSFDLMQNLYNSSQSTDGQLIMNDPSMRLSINNVNRARIGRHELSAAIWLQVYAPVSTWSREIHEYTAFSAAYIPTLHFRGSRFTVSGVGSIKVNLAQNMSQTGTIAPTQIVAAGQGAYRLSAWTSVFLMNHVDLRAGPQVSLPPQVLAPDSYRMAAMMKRHQSCATDGFMTGASFQITRNVGLSPRLDWQVDQNINTTTVGVNASFHFI